MSIYGIAAISENPKTGEIFEDGKIRNQEFEFVDTKYTAKFRMEVGRLRCQEVRDFLNECKFKGMDIEYYEGGGIVSHDFLIKGSCIDVFKLHKILKSYQ